MALPPILSNLPILRLFSADRLHKADAHKGDDAKGADAKGATDSVVLSETVQGMPKTPAEARTMAMETGGQLSDGLYALGLSPDFSE